MDYGARGLESKDLKSHKFYMKDGIAYNVADIGNYLFGRGAAELDLLYSEVVVGSNLNNTFFGRTQNRGKNHPYDFGPKTYEDPGVLDSKADQNAIYRGYISTDKGSQKHSTEMKSIIPLVKGLDKSRTTIF